MCKTHQPHSPTALRAFDWQLEAVVGISNAELWWRKVLYIIRTLGERFWGILCDQGKINTI